MPKKKVPSSSQVQGRVVAFNISPKGNVEGVLLKASKGLVQVNFPRPHAEVLSRSMRVGASVSLKAEREPDEGVHPVYTASDEVDEAVGKIARLNYALHGEVNGYHLENGTFLHVKPDGAKKLKLDVGDEVEAAGTRRVGSDAIVLEVRELKRVGARARR